MESLSVRIARGETALDTFDKKRRRKRKKKEPPPQWFETITRMDLFSMKMVGECLLGQIFGHYQTGLTKLGIDPKDAAYFGFASPSLSEYPAMTEMWYEQIHARLQKKVEALIVPQGCAFAGFCPLSVGSHGDNRAYLPGVYIRFPHSMSMEERGLIATNIINKVKGITRVLMEIET